MNIPELVILYQPTPLEQVHAFYLAQNVFGIAPNTPIHISGRNAVPFLTQSGIDRMLLRNIWSAADPQNIGTLTALHQFHLMLRLVAMAQAGFLNTQQDSNSMRVSAQQQAGIQLMLPTFSSVVLPPQEQLFSMYGAFVVQQQTQIPVTPPPAMGFGTPQGSFGGVQSVGSFGSASVQTTSISDAFGGLGPVENAPLPSLGEFPPAPPTNANNAENGAAAPPPPAISDTSMIGTNSVPSDAGSVPSVATGGTSISDAFVSAGGVPDAPLPQLGQTMTTGAIQPPPPLPLPEKQQQQQDQHQITAGDDEFGVFENAEGNIPTADANNFEFGDFGSAPERSQVGGPAAGSAMSASDAFGGGLTDTPIPSLGQSSDTHQQESGDEDFGGFEHAASTVPNSGQEKVPHADSLTADTAADPFVSMEVANAPLQSLDPFGGGSNDPVVSNVVSDADDDIDFGGFEDAGGQDTSQIDLPPFQGTPQEQTAQSDFNVFQDAALSQLDGVQQDPSTQLQPPQSQTPSSDDPFSAFDAVAPPPAPMPSMMGLQEISSGDVNQPGANAANSVIAEETSGTGGNTNDFGDWGGFEDADTTTSGTFRAQDVSPLDPMTVASTQSDSDLTGFEDTSRELQQTPAAPSADPFSAFDAVAPPDTPLPSMASPSVVPGGDPSAQKAMPSTSADKIGSDDAFGGFENAAGTHPMAIVGGESDLFGSPPSRDASTAANTSNADDWGDFGAAPGSTDAATSVDADELAVLEHQGTTQKVAALGSESENYFGNFGAAPASTAADTGNFGHFGSASAAAAIDAIGDSGAASARTDTDEPGNFGAASAPASPVDDDFGDFGEAPVSVPGAADDFGDFGAAPASAPAATDDFGDFGSARARIAADDFGDFDAAPAPSVPAGAGSDLFSAQESQGLPTAESQNATVAAPSPATNDWGDFGTASATATPPAGGNTDPFGAPEMERSPSEIQPSTDEFGDFDEAPARTAQTGGDTILFGPSETSQEPSVAVAAPPAATDDWGDFDAAPVSSAPDSVPSNASESQIVSSVDQGGNFGAFDAAPSLNAHVSADDDDWGDFDRAPALQDNSAVTDKMNDFGAFDAAPSASSPPISNQNDDFEDFNNDPAPQVPTANDEADDFGAFDAATNIAVPPASANDDDWGDFGDAPASKAPAPSEGSADFGAFDSTPAFSGSRADEDNDDWGAFDNALAPSAAVEDGFGNFESSQSLPQSIDGAEANQERIRALSTKLPEAFLRKKDSSDHVDLGESYDVNLGMEFPLDSHREKKFDRCVQLLELLSTDDSKLGSAYWQQAFEVLRDELLLGKSILLEAKDLSPVDLGKVNKPLLVMVTGLIEYMRIVRSIVATVGDILMLDASALLTIDTLESTWCSLSILETAVEIENIWKELLSFAYGLLKLDNGRINEISLSEIRKKCCGRTASEKLCHLTLQPVAKKPIITTRSKVSWNGLHYMACSANFLAHKCPFYVASR